MENACKRFHYSPSSSPMAAVLLLFCVCVCVCFFLSLLVILPLLLSAFPSFFLFPPLLLGSLVLRICSAEWKDETHRGHPSSKPLEQPRHRLVLCLGLVFSPSVQNPHAFPTIGKPGYRHGHTLFLSSSFPSSSFSPPPPRPWRS